MGVGDVGGDVRVEIWEWRCWWADIGRGELGEKCEGREGREGWWGGGGGRKSDEVDRRGGKRVRGGGLGVGKGGVGDYQVEIEILIPHPRSINFR